MAPMSSAPGMSGWRSEIFICQKQQRPTAGGGCSGAQQACRPSSVSFRGRTVTIYLGPRLLEASSSQPEGLGRAPLAPSYLALLRAGFSRPLTHARAGGLLPHHFTLTLLTKGGMFLCHFPSGRPAWALPSALPVWSSDLPLPPQAGTAVTQPAGLRGELYSRGAGALTPALSRDGRGGGRSHRERVPLLEGALDSLVFG